MRILHVITSLSTGGAEIMLQKLVHGLNPQQYTNAVVSLTTTAPIGDELQATGIPVVGLRGCGGMLTPRQAWRLMRTYRNAQPDVVHAWMYHSNVAAQALTCLQSSKRRPGLILSVRGALHAPKEQNTISRLVRAVDATMSSRSDAIVFNSRRAAEQHVALGYDRQRIQIIPNGFDTERFECRPAERVRVRSELRCGDCTLIGLVARFDRLKGHRVFLEAARLVADASPRYKFLLVGRGCDGRNTELLRWLAELGLTERVHLMGERRDIASIDNALDIAVCSSVSESFPNAIGEAMSCGVPCVVTDVGDCGHLIGDSGYCVPPRDPRALAGAIVRMGELPERERLAMGARARQRVVAEFSIAFVVRRFSELYDRFGHGS